MPDALDFDELLPELSEWRAEYDCGPEDWLYHRGNHALAVGYSFLFWPSFQVIDDYVLRATESEDNLRAWERSAGRDRRAIEAVMNHVHMIDLHQSEVKPTEAQLRRLGRVLKQIHEAKLALNFPERRFVVSFQDEPGLDPVEYELTFWQLPENPPT